MSNHWVNVALIVLLIIISGVFASAEMALVSLRESQVRQLALKGARGRKVAHLVANPNRFLSVIQLCVTFAGFLSASVGAATLSGDLAPWIARLGIPLGAAQVVALVVVTILISYFSIVLSELAAKRLAMQRAESVAMGLAGFVDGVAVLAKPVIWFLGVSTNFVVRLLGGDPKAAREAVTEEELRQMVTTSSTLSVEEREIVDEVFAAGERSLREVMIPRTETEFLDGAMPVAEAVGSLKSATHSRFPVTGASVDDIVGFLHIRDLMFLDADDPTPVRQLARPIMSLPDTVRVLNALTAMRAGGSHMAIVRDEYGGTAGIVTLEDLVEELVGDIHDEFDAETPAAKLEAGRVEVEGLTTLEQFFDLTGLVLPEGPYDTVAGFWVALKGALPHQGDSVTVHLVRELAGREVEPVRVAMTVIAMDGRRAARLLVRRLDD